jgi:hypothetical protein
MALLWRCWRTIEPSSIFQFFAIPCAHAFLHFFSFTDYLNRLATTNFIALTLLTVVSQNPLPAQVSSIIRLIPHFSILSNRVTFFLDAGGECFAFELGTCYQVFAVTIF